MLNFGVDYGGQGGHQAVMANQAHNCGEPPKCDDGSLPSPEPIGEPEIAVAEAWARYQASLPEIKLPPRNIQALRDGKSYVYFIAGEDTPIKIGFSNQPHERLAILQTAHWCRLSIVAKVEGSLAVEADYHRRFAAHRLHGEWFAPHPDILAEIERLKGRAA